MTFRLHLEGIYTAIVTPFTSEGSFDFDALADEVFDQLVRGIDLMITWPQTSYDERIAVSYIPYAVLPRLFGDL